MIWYGLREQKHHHKKSLWHGMKSKWNGEEEHDYQTISVSSPALQNWFMEMKENSRPWIEYAPNDDALDDDENLELHMVDYSIGYNVIYAAFSWSVADEAYELMRSLAQKHKVGFLMWVEMMILFCQMELW